MSSDLQDLLRRLKPEKRRGALKPRAASELAWMVHVSDWPSRLLYDTTVYVDMLQRRFPSETEVVMCAADTWHSTVTEAELLATCGLLNPDHPGTAKAVRQIIAVLEHRPPYRTIAPDREIWMEAGVLSGILARRQNYGRAERRRTLNDALIFATARKHGLTVLTRNNRDFDLLQQLEPSVRVLFYEAA